MPNGAIFVPSGGADDLRQALLSLIQLRLAQQRQEAQERQTGGVESGALALLNEMLAMRQAGEPILTTAGGVQAAPILQGAGAREPGLARPSLREDNPALAAFAQLVGTAGADIGAAAPFLLEQAQVAPVRRAQAREAEALARIREAEAPAAEAKLAQFRATQPMIQQILKDPKIQRWFALTQAGLGAVVEAELERISPAFATQQAIADRTTFNNLLDGATSLISARERQIATAERFNADQKELGLPEITVPEPLTFDEALRQMNFTPEEFVKLKNRVLPGITRGLEALDRRTQVVQKHKLTQEEIASLETWLLQNNNDVRKTLEEISKAHGPAAASIAREYFQTVVTPRARRTGTQ